MSLAILVPLCVSSQFQNYSIPKQVLVEVGIVFLTALWIVCMAVEGRIRLIPSSLHAFFLAFIGVCLLSLFPACNKAQALRVTFHYACYFLVALLVSHTVRGEREIRRLGLVIALTGGSVALIGFLQYTGICQLYTRWNHPVSTIGNVTFVAAYYNVAFPIALALVFLCRSLRQRVAVVAACLLMAGHLMILGSRGGWFGAVIALTIFVAAGLLRERRRILRPLIIGLSAVLILGVCVPTLSGLVTGIQTGRERNLRGIVAGHWQRIINHINAGLQMADHASRQRLYLWKDTFRMALNHPVLGVGAGNFEYIIPQYASTETLELRRWMERRMDQRLMAFSAHNEYLEIWAETGSLGLGVFCALLCQIAALLYGLFNRYLRGVGNILTVGLAAAVAASLVHAFFCANLQIPASALHFWLAVGMLWSLNANTGDERRFTLLPVRSGRTTVAVTATCIAALLTVIYVDIRTLMGAYYHMEGASHYRRKQYEDAQAQLERAVRYTPPRAFSTYHLLGLARHKGKQWDSAIEAFQESLRRHPNNAAAHHDIGLSLAETQKYEEAIAQFRQAVRLDPCAAEYRLHLGQALGTSDEHQAAIEELQEAVRLNPGNPEAYHVLGINHRRNGNLEDAVDALRMALALAPDDAQILNSLAVTCVQVADFQTAQHILQRLVDRYPTNADYRINLAVTLLNIGNAEAALHQCQQILNTAPDNVKALALMGQSYQSAGYVRKARETYREILRRDPGDPIIRGALRELQEPGERSQMPGR